MDNKRSTFLSQTRSISPEPEIDSNDDPYEQTEQQARQYARGGLLEQPTDQACEDVHIVVLDGEIEMEQLQHLEQLLAIVSKRKKPDSLHETDNRLETEKQLLVKANPKRFSQTQLEARISRVRKVVTETYKKIQSAKVSRGDVKRLEVLQAKNLENLEGLEWTIDNLGLLLEAEVYLGCHQSVVAAWVPAHRTSTMVAIRVHGINRYIVLPVEDAFVENFFTTHALEGGRFGSGFSLVSKYDRRETLEATIFAKARKLNQQQWEVMDRDGKVTVIDSSWLADPQNLSAIDKAFITSCWEAGSVEFQRITPGSAIAINQLPPAGGETLGRSLPPVLYRSKIGEHLCIAKSVASALAGVGYPDEARMFFFRVQEEIQGALSMFNLVDRALLGVGIRTISIRLKGLKLSSECGSMTNVVERLQTQFRKHGLVLAGLRGRRNNCNHCIVIANGEVVFDCNKSAAETLSAASLETCCGGAGFHSFAFAKRLVVAGKWFAKKSKKSKMDLKARC